MTWPGAWPSYRLSESRRRLEGLRNELDQYNGDNKSIEHALARLVVVRSSGHVEFTLEECLGCFADAKADPRIASHLRSTLFKGRNPTPGRIETLLDSLDNSMVERIRIAFDADDELKRRELKYMVSQRNLIAHGGSDGISRRRALDLSDVALGIGDLVVSILDPR